MPLASWKLCEPSGAEFSQESRHVLPSFNGLALGIVRLKPGAQESVTLRVTTDGLTSANILITPSGTPKARILPHRGHAEAVLGVTGVARAA